MLSLLIVVAITWACTVYYVKRSDWDPATALFASLPGAQAAFLKTLRSFLAFGGFPAEQVAALHSAMPSIQAPALVLWGKQDRLLPVRQADTLKRLLPKVEVKLYDRCGHAPMVECAQNFNDDVLRYWAALEAAGA